MNNCNSFKIKTSKCSFFSYTTSRFDVFSSLFRAVWKYIWKVQSFQRDWCLRSKCEASGIQLLSSSSDKSQTNEVKLSEVILVKTYELQLLIWAERTSRRVQPERGRSQTLLKLHTLLLWVCEVCNLWNVSAVWRTWSSRRSRTVTRESGVTTETRGCLLLRYWIFLCH